MTGRTLRSYAAVVLAFGGLILIGMGLYFIFLRPALLPEDARYMGSSVVQIQDLLPELAPWLQRVFSVLGGYMLATGLLTVHLAITTFRSGTPGATMVVALSGLGSIGAMAVTNFAIDSDFKWLLLLFTLPWVLAIALSSAGGRKDRRTDLVAPRA